MTVEQWIDANVNNSKKTIRMMDYSTNKGLHSHWLVYADSEVKKVKISTKWIFIFVDKH